MEEILLPMMLRKFSYLRKLNMLIAPLKELLIRIL